MPKTHNIPIQRHQVEAMRLGWKRALCIAFGGSINQGDTLIIRPTYNDMSPTQDPSLIVYVVLIEQGDPIPLPKPYALVHFSLEADSSLLSHLGRVKSLPRAENTPSQDMTDKRPTVHYPSANETGHTRP